MSSLTLKMFLLDYVSLDILLNEGTEGTQSQFHGCLDKIVCCSNGKDFIAKIWKLAWKTIVKVWFKSCSFANQDDFSGSSR